jgi:hypothetical protein
MPLDPHDKERLKRAYEDHMKALNHFDNPLRTTSLSESDEERIHETEARLERLADEIGVQPEDYPELEQMIQQELEGPSISD